jgi:hypothetical protein
MSEAVVKCKACEAKLPLVWCVQSRRMVHERGLGTFACARVDAEERQSSPTAVVARDRYEEYTDPTTGELLYKRRSSVSPILKDSEAAGVLTRQEIDALECHLDDGTEWQTQNEFYDAWSPRLSNRLHKLLTTARMALIDHDRSRDRVKELEAALSAAVEMLNITEWSDESSEQACFPSLLQLRSVLRKSQEAL